MSPILNRLSSAGGGGTGGFSFGKKVLQVLVDSAPPVDPPTDFLIYKINPPSTTVTITSEGSSFLVPAQSYDVDWGDGNVDSYTDTSVVDRTHTYSTAGPYTVTINSTSGFYRPFFEISPGRDDLVSVDGLGGAALGFNDGNISLYDSWRGCANLTTFTSNVDMSHIEYLVRTWYDCTSLTSFGPTDFSTALSFSQAWYGCTSLTSFPSISAPNATRFSGAWQFCTSLTTFPANTFDNTGTLASSAFLNTFNNCALTAQSIENILVSLDTNGATGIKLNIDGGTNAAYSTWSSAAQTALSNLQGKGWTVAYNS